MGITTITGTHLVDARNRGTNFRKTATIGRLSLCIPREDLERLQKCRGMTNPEPPASLFRNGFADEFIRQVLDAETVTSFDYSDYQGADITHDFNHPVPKTFHGAFDVLIDGGTMEHIFDVRQVLMNYMEMVKTGGSIFINVPANNLLGHGLYQFSPELFYRVFSHDNGFVTESVSVIESPFTSVEASRRHRCYRVADPRIAGKRMRVITARPLMLWVHARKTGQKPLFQTPPMQSDYAVTWDQHRKKQTGRASPDHGGSGSPRTSFTYLTFWQEIRRHVMQARKHALRNRKFFKRYKC